MPVFITSPSPVNEVLEIAERLKDQTTFPCVLATLVKVEGSSYRREGARRLLTSDSPPVGSISGGCLEQDLDEHASELLYSANTFKLITYDTSSENDALWGTGTGCHGVVHILLEKLPKCPDWVEHVSSAKTLRNPIYLQTVWDSKGSQTPDIGTAELDADNLSDAVGYIQKISPPHRLVIFGAGDDAIPLNALANQLGWETVIFDPRPSFAAPARFPGAVSVECVNAEKSATQIDWDNFTMAVVMTHHYRYDLPILKTLLPLHLPYLGLLGPKQRGKRLLSDAGYAPETTNLHNPVGLDLGGDGSTSVALSIVSEIQAHLNQRSGVSLSQRAAPIHDGV